MPSLSSGVTVALRLATFEARNGAGVMGPGHLLLALSRLSDRALPERFEDPQKRRELTEEGERLRERFAEAGVDPDVLRERLRAALAGEAEGEAAQDAAPDAAAAAGDGGVLMRTIRRAGELGERDHAGVIELLRAILEQPPPRCRPVFELLGVDEPLYAFFPELPRPARPLPGTPQPAGGDEPAADEPVRAASTPANPVSLSGTGGGRRGRHAGEARTPLLDRYGRDLTLLAREGSLAPLIGREEEMLSLARVLVRQRKANAVLVGEPGVGKTGIVEGLAARLAGRAAPRDLADARIVELTMSSMVAGTKYRGEFEERMEAVLKEVRQTPGLILFLDELHNVLGAGGAAGASDAASILKPMLARGEIRVIGATTAGEYQRYIEEDPALQRRFAVVWVEEPTRAEAVEILEGISGHLTRHHRVEIGAEAPAAAVELAIRYLPDQRLPDKAIDLLDQACAALRIPSLAPPAAAPAAVAAVPTPNSSDAVPAAKPVGGVAAALAAELAAKASNERSGEASIEPSTEADIDNVDDVEVPEPGEPASETLRVGRAELVAVVAERTRVPVERVAVSEAQRLLGLEEHLSRRVVGQDAAVAAVAKAVRASRAGLGDPRRPIGAFLLAGPTGSGKTELAKALAEFLFDDEQRLVRVDMSEYQDGYTVSRLLGAPPGYVGHDREGQLSGPLRAHPHSVVLFDEVEKAHPEVLDLFLQILDEGRLTDARGRRISFTETVVLLTTNLGYERGGDATIGFRSAAAASGQAAAGPSVGRAKLLAEVRKALRPELLGRLGEVVVFEPLGRAALDAVLDKLIKRVEARIADKALSLELDQGARELLVREGTDPRSGARALEQAVERVLVQPLGRELLGGRFTDGARIFVSADDSAAELTFSEREF